MNFGIIYGQGAFALADKLDLQELKRNNSSILITETYPKLKIWMAEQVAKSPWWVM